MTQELVSLTIIMAVAAVSPIVAQLIPGRFIPQTVLLLVTGAALGPYGLGVIEVNDAVKLLSELGMLAMNPEILVLDEPTAMLDPQGRANSSVNNPTNRGIRTKNYQQ